MSFVLAFTFLICSFPSKTKKTHAADESIKLTQTIDGTVFNYVTLSIAGKTLTLDNIKSVDTDGDGKIDTSYIITKDTITLTFKPLEYNYKTDFDDSCFIKSTTIKSDPIEKNPDTGNFPTTFTVNGEKYNYQITEETGKFSISKQGKNYSIGQSDFITLNTIDDSTREFEFTTSYTLSSDSGDKSFLFNANQSNSATVTSYYSLNFLRPVLDFERYDVALFTGNGLDIGNNDYTTGVPQRELSYEKMTLEFQNNNYTEFNPLYCNINHNGFTYTFMLYSKKIGSYEYLFVEYYDEQRQGQGKNHDESLATQLETLEDDTVSVKKPIYKYIDDTTEFNKFSINFNTTGRYEIEIYDSTYLLLKNQPIIQKTEITNEKGEKETVTEIIEPEDNEINYNYFNTSFYIKAEETGADSAYENVYAIMQSYETITDEETNVTTTNFLDYIVSNSTQNNNVQVTIKNLNYYLSNDTFIQSQSNEALDDLVIVECTKATLSGSTNVPVPTYFKANELKTLFASQQSNEKVLTINCEDDAIYEIVIYKYNYNENTQTIEKKQNKYQFTIVKNPRTFFRVTNVDEFNDPTEIDGETSTPHYADTPYETKPETYKINIDANITLGFKFTNSVGDEFKQQTLYKTYLNEYTINYAMQQVKIDRVEFADNSDDKGKLGIAFYGVGTIDVTIVVNSVTSTYKVKSGTTLVFDTYGTYDVSIKDSMGTVGTAVINYKKPTNISSIIMIVLVGVIALAVVLFIVSSRGRMKTR